MNDPDGTNKSAESNDALNRSEIVESTPKKDTDDKKRINLPAWIQAGSAVALVVFTYFLTQYSSDQAGATRRAVKLTEDSVRVARETLESTKVTQQNTLAEMKAQSKAMQDSADATKKSVNMAARGIAISEKNMKLIDAQFTLEQRPWLQVKDVKFDNTLEANKLGFFSFSVMNVGKTPAQQVNFKLTSRFHMKGEPDIVETSSSAQDLPIGPGRTVVAPGLHEPELLSQEIIAGYNSGAFVLELFIEVTYRDVFNGSELHSSGYCGTYDPKFGLEFLTSKSGCNYMK